MKCIFCGITPCPSDGRCAKANQAKGLLAKQWKAENAKAAAEAAGKE